MKITRRSFFRISHVNQFRIKSVLFIAILWTLTDFIVVLLRGDSEPVKRTNSLWFREGLIFFLSLIMGYLFVYKLKKILRSYPLWANYLLKSIILLGSALVISFVLQF